MQSWLAKKLTSYVMAHTRAGDVGPTLDGIAPPHYRELVRRVRSIAAREADEIRARIPKVLRRVGGYNIDTISPGGHNLAQLLVGSEGTLAYFTANGTSYTRN